MFPCWSSWVREGTLDSYGHLAHLPFESSAGGEGPNVGITRQVPTFLVCTHGKKDTCCAELGRPIMNAVTSVEETDMWECTHIGGDRFAANTARQADFAAAVGSDRR